MDNKKIIKSNKQSRNWCFTDFKNITLEFYKNIFDEHTDIIRYICIGIEICPKTKKVHIQGWIQLINKKTMGGVKKLLKNKTICLFICRGDELSNNKYCKKEGNSLELGKWKTQGQRSDLETIKKQIDKGVTDYVIAQDHFGDYIRYFQGFKEYRKLVNKEQSKEFRKVEVEYIWGGTGTGKTKRATKDKEHYMITGANLKWFDGYENEKTLVIDEYNNNVEITRMLNLLDGYMLRLEIKGSFTYARWTKVIITSNLSPEELHPNAKDEHRNALFRRITKITHITKPVGKVIEKLPK